MREQSTVQKGSPLSRRKGLAFGVTLLTIAAFSLSLFSCATEIAGTASGTENTITLSMASFDENSMPVARVRFHDAAALPKAVALYSQATTVEAIKSGEGFIAALPAGRLWTAELIGQDSSYRLWIDSCGSVEGAIRLQSGPLLKSVALQGKLSGELGEEAWIGIVGTDRFAQVAPDGEYALNGVIAANLRMIVARKSMGNWKINTLSGWSRATGDVELPASIDLPIEEKQLDAWGCSSPKTLVEASTPLDAPASDLFYTLLLENGSTSLLRIDLCHGLWSRAAQLPTAAPSLLFSNSAGRWAYTSENDTLWNLSAPESPEAIAGSYLSQIGILSAAADETGFATYLYRPAGNRISTYSSIDLLMQDDPLLSFTPEQGDSALLLAAEKSLLLLDKSGTVRSFNRSSGEPLGKPWLLSQELRLVRGAMRSPSGRLVILTEKSEATTLVVVEERTGESLLSIGGIPAGATGLAR